MKFANHHYLALATIIMSILISQSRRARAQNDLEKAPIQYSTADVGDPVARLSEQLGSGERELEFEKKFGYLKSVLEALEIPTSSQSLVFSKTSLQLSRISPRRPRALYFNDDVYVGYCQNGDVLEIAATDPKQGAIFYTLSQKETAEPKFKRDNGSCLTCHATNRTQRVPGYLVRSVFPDAAGRPLFRKGTFTSDHTSPFNERWGGWYVSGTHGSMGHMGNVVCRDDDEPFDYASGANDLDLSDNFRTEKYLTPHSDIAALMVLEHQTQMHNALAAANYETRRALHQSFSMNELLGRPEGTISELAERRIESSAERVLKHLLFCDEFPLTDQIRGSSSFANEFVARGKPDSRGRSLRDFEMKTRMFRYPCSYLIHSEAFASLPDPVRIQVLRRLKKILNSAKTSAEFAHLTRETKRDITAILMDTHPEFARLD